ncbi:MAG TPA: Holliday junction branch migration protein RuvA [Alphaproteobacteria bacterium]|nr:Holliday junction branch migration protein RuvA [Alphaproteobacteria bacterium]
MIGKLTGKIEFTGDDHVLIDVNGVGYVVHGSARTLNRLRQMGETATLLIKTQVREDAITLIGFADAEEQSAFTLLTTVQGVGTRVALSLLSSLSPGQLSGAVASGDAKLLSSADGVGAKLAARLITELKDKVAGMASPSVVAFPAAGKGSAGGVAGDAVSSLANLGFRRDEAFAAVMRALEKNRAAGLNEVIRVALQDLSPSESRMKR